MNIIVIPARLESSRLMNKLMLKKHNKTIIEHTIDAALQSKLADHVILATDSGAIIDAVSKIDNSKFVTYFTKLPHACGTSRVLEAVQAITTTKYLSTDEPVECVVNWQGDEPELKADSIDKLISKINKAVKTGKHQYNIATLACRATASEMDDPTKVKVVLDQSDKAMYFSRSHIPYDTIGLRHIGVYAFDGNVIAKLSGSTSLSYCRNSSEKLEQLAWLEAGFTTHVLTIPRTPCGIDSEADYKQFVARPQKKQRV